jgi:predicted nucleic acid-binding protein
MLRWRMLVAHGRTINHTYSQPDLILAATAIEHGLTLVTRNTNDFVGLPGLSMLNPWTLP